MPKTEAIDRNKLDYEDMSTICPNIDSEILDLIDDICNIFKEISSLRNRYKSAANVKKLFGHLITQFDILEKEQKWKVFIVLSTKYYINVELFKEKISQDMCDFESLVKTVNDVRKVIEPGKENSIIMT